MTVHIFAKFAIMIAAFSAYLTIGALAVEFGLTKCVVGLMEGEQPPHVTETILIR